MAWFTRSNGNDDTTFFCRVGERFRKTFSIKGTFREAMIEYDRGTCSFWRRELFVIIVSLIIVIILGAATLGSYRSALEKQANDKDLLKPIDKVTVISTVVLIIIALLHYGCFALGYPKIIGLPQSEYSHALLKYSLFFGFAIAIIGPVAALYRTDAEGRQLGVTLYWTSILLAILFAYYLYALIHHYIRPKLPKFK